MAKIYRFIDESLTLIPAKHHYKVLRAIKRVNWLLNDQSFLDIIASHGGFAFATPDKYDLDGKFSGSDLLKTIKWYRDQGMSARVAGYYSSWPWSKVYAHVARGVSDKINLNLRKIDRSVESVANTLLHELLHCIDNAAKNVEFGHGDNQNNASKKDSAPYWVGGKSEGFKANVPDYGAEEVD